jgi:hypothetical protein
MTVMYRERESDDPWRGRQPQYQALSIRGPDCFELVTTLPSGEPVSCRLDVMKVDPRDS